MTSNPIDIVDDEPQEILKSDYETASEWQPDFDSDCEPPQDKIQEKKMLYKGKTYRLYKRILQLGARDQFMPAAYDKVTFKYAKVESEEMDKEQLSNTEFVEHQMGMSEEITEIMLYAIQSMKKGEIAIFTIENIRKNKVNYQRELVGYEYFMVELQTFTTIIDLYGDLMCMKTLNVRSTKRAKYVDSDEVKLTGKIYQSDKILHDFTMQETELLSIEKHSGLLIKLCESMKQDEDVCISVKSEYIRDRMEEQDHVLYKDIDWSQDVCFDIKVDKLVNIKDIKEDNTLLVKTMVPSFSSAQAEPHSKMYFDYKIYHKETDELIYESQNKFERILPANQETTEVVETLDCKKYYIDEFELSRAMTLCLKDLKKMEDAEYHITGCKHFKYGDDYEIVKSWLAKNKGIKKIPEDIKQKYQIRCYNFSQNINTFTMSFDEKIIMASRKKDLATKYIKQKAYKRAKKVLSIIKEIVQMNVTEKEQIIMAKPLNISCLSNFALCCWKLEEWVALDKTCNEILELDVFNYKAFYRKMLANHKIQNYEFVESTIQDYLDENQSKKDSNDMKELIELLKKNTTDYKNHVDKEKQIYKNMFG